ncbi:hypothetical protein [Sulfuricurvum sp.]|uniref:hypothetical protein n=1 Tax=Sulfuricurvum sp. TaxID=2025608 RepID=UPI0026321DB9|nr:hypothetical protein [Sulfuricurvum sp.]MDD2266687.1 hypothetical protein [Sulfuricurvum sp.]MDD2784135.1 hypothetical protein [Sulfuricurvum sp.]
MFELHRNIIQTFITEDIRDISTYGGYKGAYILKITTKRLTVAEKIAAYCESLGGEAVIKENHNLIIFEVYCIAEDPSVYTLKTTEHPFEYGLKIK